MTLKNTSEVKPTTIHADAQGQSYPVFAIAHLLGIDLMPRIRNWKDLLFFRPSRTAQYEHIDALFGEAGRNVIDWRLIETHFRDLMRVIVSIREGAISSVLLLRRLRSGSRRNATYTAFREVGKVIRPSSCCATSRTRRCGRGISPTSCASSRPRAAPSTPSTSRRSPRT
ncbi:Tn3 family transposase [Streptomyces sp. NPDC000927]|uniref:Tn3 family transposase n=1 Tax=Streptomyces sp. NPDC000927 TaxID=3154371 RepID=UPI00331EE9F6